MNMWPPEAVSSINDTWMPSQGAIEQEIAALTGSMKSQLNWRIPETFKMETFIFMIWLGWRAFALMLIGMSFYKLGILYGSLSRKDYAKLIAATLPASFINQSTSLYISELSTWG